MTADAPANSLILAHKLGSVAHVSGLLRRINQASAAGDCLGDWLLKVAIARGATHYRRDFDPKLPADLPVISDEEIGIALCLGEHVYNATYLRAAAQLLSSARTNPERLFRLAVQERCEAVLLYIATVAGRFAPALEPWRYFRTRLEGRRPPPPDRLPHWSRFVSHTGVTPFGGASHTEWLKRHEQPAKDS